MPEMNTNTRLQSKEIKKIVNDAMVELDRSNYKILNELYFNDNSIHQLSKKFGISRSGIRYRKTKALKQLKNIILRQAGAENLGQDFFT